MLDATTGPKVTFNSSICARRMGWPVFPLLLTIVFMGGTKGEAVDLSSPGGAVLHQVTVEVQIKGFLLHQPSGKPVQQLPILAKGRLQYEEQAGKSLAVRYYHTAEATIGVAQGSVTPALDVRRRLIAVDLTTPRPTFYSPAGPLTRAQLDLLDVQGNSALLARLLPGKKVEEGEKWIAAPDSLAALLSLDAVYQADVTGTLVGVDKGVALVELRGSLSGAAGGVPTDLNLNASYGFDLAKRQVVSLSMAVDEKRQIGPAEPGFEVSAQVEVVVEPLERSDVLTNEVLAHAARTAAEPHLLTYASESAGLRLMHDRRWRMMREGENTVVLRLIENGNVITQCNLHRLIDLEPEKQPTLEEFKADVKKSLGEHFGQFEDAGAEFTPLGLRRLRVTVSGVVSEVPIRWNYYHLSDNAGRQATCIFTLQQARLEQLGDQDLQLTDVLVLENRPKKPQTAGTPEPAEPRTSRKTP